MLTEREKEIALECESYYELHKNFMSIEQKYDLFLSRIREEQDIFAYSTFDGEGGYDLRLHEGNESYQEEFSKRNPNYVNWVSPLFITPPAAPDCSELVEALENANDVLDHLIIHHRVVAGHRIAISCVEKIRCALANHAKRMKEE